MISSVSIILLFFLHCIFPLTMLTMLSLSHPSSGDPLISFKVIPFFHPELCSSALMLPSLLHGLK